MIIRESRVGRPRVIDWWIVLCLGSAVFSLGVIPFFDDLMLADGEMDVNSPEDMEALRFVHWGAGVVLGLNALFMGIGPFLPRREFMWVFGIVQMVVSMLCGGCFCILAAIPLLIFWVRQECRDWFRGETEEDFEEVFS